MSPKTFSTRRDFLKGTTAAAAGVALAGGWNLARRPTPPAAMN